ncbi:MAG: 2-phospho-L-lactate transferase [Burkholderiales bacterium]
MTRFVAIAGGVGGARLARGLAQVLAPDDLLVAVNTGDDFEHLGFAISPDLDTVMYTLAGLENPATGWGLANESWAFMSALERVGGETWFRLGDRDLATHVERTRRLREGESLSSVTANLAARLGVTTRITPMSDAPVRTIVHTDLGALAFQDYFVRRQCQPAVNRIAFEGAARAAPTAMFAKALADPRLEAIIICPSNPFLSVAPMLAMPAIDDWWSMRRVPVVAVSPIVGGAAVKGPAGKLLAELGYEVSASAVAQHYGNRVDRWLIDTRDEALAPGVRAMGKRVRTTDTMMSDTSRSAAVAIETLALATERAQ